MGLFDYITRFNYTIVRKKIFRKEIENSFFSGKEFALPKVEPINTATLSPVKKNYPFNFYFDDKSRSETSSALKNIEDPAKIISEADRIIENKYNLLNSGEIFVGDEINWHLDYRTNFKWPEVLVWRNDFYKFPKGTDIKYPWELARFHQGVKLGKAYLITGDEKYTDKFLNIFYDFNDKNPFCIGVNWAASNEVSIRISNIIFAFSLFLHSGLIDNEVLSDLQKMVLQHSIFIENNFSYPKYPGHEFLSNLLGLMFASLFLKTSAYGKRILNFVHTAFEQEIRSQIFEDGVSFEQSLSYHSFILEHFYLAKILFAFAGFKTSDEYNRRLRSMFIVIDKYLRDDKTIPQIGDAESSRVIPINLADNGNDASTFITVGKFLFPDLDAAVPLKETAEILLLYGTKELKRMDFKNIDTSVKTSAAFKSGGHYIMRTDNTHLFIDAGEIGRHGSGAPGHNDTFTFELFYKNKKFIVDSGTYSFYADPELRNFLRSVKAHNTFYIDNLQLAEFENLFKIKDDLTKPELLEWTTGSMKDVLSVQHFAYARLQDPVVCRRTFTFHKINQTILIKDEFIGGAAHEVISNLHFHPAVQLNQIDKQFFRAVQNDVLIDLNITSSSGFFSAGVFDSQYSPAYGVIQKSKKISIILKDKFPVHILTEIILH